MIQILFFAQTRELIGLSELEFSFNETSMSVEQLKKELAQRGDAWHFALLEKKVLCSINHQLVDDQAQIQTGDEVAFFPPVTGG